MIEGLRLTIDGNDMRMLLQQRIDELREQVARWSKVASGEDDDSDDPVQIPQHICEYEAERLRWRVEVLEFLRDHLEPAETYLLGQADLEFGDLLPPRPGSVEQQDYEERTAVGFHLERLAKNVGRLDCAWGSSAADPVRASNGPDFNVSRIDTKDGPEIVMIERK
jgi:hypothetical protein